MSSKKILILLTIIPFVSAFSDEGPGGFDKTLVDVEQKYTNVGNIGLTITNFGTYGSRNSNFPSQPSCRYPISSRIEHIYQGGIWIGAVKNNNPPLVSTGTSGASRQLLGSVIGYEFNAQPQDSIMELSSLTDERPISSQYSPFAISHQDFVCEYVDTFTRVPSSPNRDTINFHTPLGIKIHQESYAYNFPFADFFVILRYNITNVSSDTLDSVYVGLWNNTVVRNTELNNPRNTGTAYFSYGAHGFDLKERMVYSFDPVGLPYGRAAIANSYIGIKLLGTTPFPSEVDSLGDLYKKINFNAWEFRQSLSDAWRASPSQDYSTDQWDSRYSRMTFTLPQADLNTIRTVPGNYIHLFSVGPFSRLNPGDSVEVVFAVVCAKKTEPGPARWDSTWQRTELYSHAGWAQLTYNGEDINGNNILDAGEDIARRDSVSPSEFGLRFDPDGKITRYLLPTPPRQPKVHLEVGNQSVILYWDKTSEESIDPVSGKKDFEGYRIYRSIAGADFLNHSEYISSIPLVGEFDRPNNAIGYNTGFSQILMDSAKYFSGDSVAYWYRFPPLTRFLFESFESAWINNGTVPDLWTKTNVTGAVEWGQRVSPLIGQSPPADSIPKDGVASAWFPTNVTIGYSTRLESPIVDLSETKAARLKFFYANRDGTDQLHVRISTDAGMTWTTLTTLQATNDNTWKQQYVNLSSVVGKANLKIGFEAVADGGISDIWLDKVTIESEQVEVTHLNGWQYVYGISAFDSGDVANGVPSLESAKVLRRAVPGVKPVSQADVPILVYPNPYYANAYWDGTQERMRKIYFANLPPRCEIRIYTLAGDVVASLDHDAQTYNGSGINWFEQYGDNRTSPQFSGGEHAWDLITRNDQAIATGLYLFTVEDKNTGKVKRGKFLIIK